jgi:hypothetical protein
VLRQQKAFNEEHLRRILSKYASYYNEVRTHLSLGKDAPCKTKGPTSQEVTGKYLVVWEKVGSDWKLAADIWNDGK